MHKIITSIFILTVLFSCEKEKKIVDTPTTPKVENTENQRIDIQTFSEIPEIGDCSTYIAIDKIQFDAQKFIFADDYGNNAYLKINDENIHIELEEDDFDPSDKKRVILHKDLKISIYIDSQEEKEDAFIFKGKMVVEKGKQKTTLPIYGKCSC